MRSAIFALGFFAAINASAHPWDEKSNSPPSVCQALTGEWNSLEKALALDIAATLSEDSATRATLEEVRISTTYIRGQTILTLMVNKKCELPDAPLSGSKYLTPALGCKKAQLTQQSAISACDQKNWQAN